MREQTENCESCRKRKANTADKTFKAIDKDFEGYVNRTVKKGEGMGKVKETDIIVKARVTSCC